MADETSHPVLLAASTRVSQAWKNGGGTTDDVLAMPVGSNMVSFDWRVSIATIDRAGEFSHFDGVDRLLVPLSAEGLTVRRPRGDEHIRQYEVLRFAGEENAATPEIELASRDLNLMLRRGAVDGSLTVCHFVGQAAFVQDGAYLLIVVLDGCIETPTGISLNDGDGVLLEGDGQLALVGEGRVAVIRVRYHSEDAGNGR